MNPLEWADRYNQARQQQGDGQWAARLCMKLRAGGLEDGTVDDVMAERLAAVRDTGCSPLELYGRADDVAAEDVERISLSGGRFVRRGFDHRAAAAGSLGLAAVLAASLGVVDLWSGLVVDWSLGGPVMVLGAAVGLFVTGEVCGLLSRRVQPWFALLAGMAAGAPFLGGAAWYSARAATLGRHSVLWWFGLAGLLGVAAEACLKWIRQPTVNRVEATDDTTWLGVARGELVRRDDMSREQVEDALGQAREFGAATGSSLAEEFGNPVGYVRSLPRRRQVSLRRTAWWFTVITLVDLLLVLDRPDPVLVMVAVLTGLCCVGFWALSAARSPRRG